MKSSKTVKEKIAEASPNLVAAQKEVALLLQELNAGTLNKQTLEAGLQALQGYVSALSDHIPTFSPDSNS